MKEPISKRRKHFYSFNDFRLYVAERELFRGAEPVALPPKALDTLLVLVSHRGHVVDKDELMKALWPDTFVEEGNLLYQVSQLRRAVGERPDGGPYIETVARRGYRFAAPVTESWEEEPAEPRLGVGGASESGGVPVTAVPPPAAAKPSRWPWAVAALATFVALAVLIVHFRQAVMPEAPLRRFALLPEQPLFITTYNTDVVISPDGRHIAYTGNSRQWIQDLDRERPRRMETVGTRSFEPFWSPDSSAIGFMQRNQLKTARIAGGSPTTVCDLPGEMWGASWSPDGQVIAFAAGSPPMLYEVAATGGEPKLILSPAKAGAAPGEPTDAIYSPHFLPLEAGPRVLLFVSGIQSGPVMMVRDFETGREETLGAGALPWYSPSGHIVYQETGLSYNLWAVAFSLDTLKITGRPFQVAVNGRYPTVATDGTLVYVQVGRPANQLVWVNRQGQKIGAIGEPQENLVSSPELSPDGRFVAIAAGTDWNSRDLWVYDIARGVQSRLTEAPEDLYSVDQATWSPGGDRLAYHVRGQGVFARNVNGTETARKLLSTTKDIVSLDWSKDGRYILYPESEPDTGLDLWYLQLNEDGGAGEPHSFLRGPFREDQASLSPDSRFAAYVSDESGQSEIYVVPFPKGDRRWLVSTMGGVSPRWSRDGRELFYVEGSDTMVAVPVSLTPTFSAGRASKLFQRRDLGGYDVSADGQRFIVSEPVGEQPPPVIRVVQNWYAEFQDRQ